MEFFGILCNNRLPESGAHMGSPCFVDLTKENGSSGERTHSLGRLYAWWVDLDRQGDSVSRGARVGDNTA